MKHLRLTFFVLLAAALDAPAQDEESAPQAPPAAEAPEGETPAADAPELPDVPELPEIAPEDDVFIPSEQVRPADELTFPTDI